MNAQNTNLDPTLLNLSSGIFDSLPSAVLPLEVFRLERPFEPAPSRRRFDSLTPTAFATGRYAEDAGGLRVEKRRSSWAVGLAVVAGCAIAALGVTHPTGFHFAAAAPQVPADQLPVCAVAAPVLAPALPAPPAPVAAPAQPVKAAPRGKLARAAVVPVDAPAPAPTADLDRAAVASAIAGLGTRAGTCRAEPGTVSMPVSVTFAPSGRVLSARVTGGPLIGTAAGGCVAATLRGARIPAFAGEPATINATLRLP